MFSHVSGNTTYTLQATNCWASKNAFDWDSITAEIDAGRPVMLGFASADNSPYSSHMTVCVGYEITDGIRYVYLSDAHKSGYQIQVFDESYNDFIAKVIVTSH